MIPGTVSVFKIYFELGGISKNQSSIFRGFTGHNSISLTNISKYFRFAKELALYRNDNDMWNVIYNGCSTKNYRDRRGNPRQLAYKRQR